MRRWISDLIPAIFGHRRRGPYQGLLVFQPSKKTGRLVDQRRRHDDVRLRVLAIDLSLVHELLVLLLGEHGQQPRLDNRVQLESEQVEVLLDAMLVEASPVANSHH